jgi:hypothetical protein
MPVAEITGQGLSAIALSVALLWAISPSAHPMITVGEDPHQQL